jgi:hypothetical protein
VLPIYILYDFKNTKEPSGPSAWTGDGKKTCCGGDAFNFAPTIFALALLQETARALPVPNENGRTLRSEGNGGEQA